MNFELAKKVNNLILEDNVHISNDIDHQEILNKSNSIHIESLSK